jgi:hypothetical protein
MIFVDTGFLLAALHRRDQLYTRAKAWHRVLVEPLLTTEYVLWEIVNQLSDPMDRPKVHKSIDEIRSAPEWDIVAASADLFERGLASHRQHADKEWSLTDCISFLVMRDCGITQALTYDHHLE